jgi:tetratricopeptide (TPR) repeat protein
LLLQEKADHEGAVAQFRAALRYIPHFALARARLASSLIKRGKFREAILESEEALRIKPDFPMALSNMAFAFAKLGEFDRSIEQYEKLLEVDPFSSQVVYSEMGKIFFKQDKLQEAAEAFKKSIESNRKTEPERDIPDVHYNLSYVLKRMGRQQEASRHLIKALEGYRRELRERPGSSEAHFVMGSALAESGDMEGASEHFRQAVKLAPSNPANHLNLIKALEAQGDIDAAIDAAQNAAQKMSETGQKSSADEFRRHLQILKSKT